MEGQADAEDRADAQHQKYKLRCLSFVEDITSQRAKALLPVFDFDGVVISGREESVYRLPVEARERSKLDEIAKKLNFSSKNYNTAYLRHIIYQYAMEKLARLSDPGPLLDAVLRIKEEKIPFYIITARSALPAVRRALAFIDFHSIEPTEIFFVGRVGKGRQLNLIGREYDDWRVVYFDDSKRHYTNARNMLGNVESVYVPSLTNVGETRAHLREVLEEAYG